LVSTKTNPKIRNEKITMLHNFVKYRHAPVSTDSVYAFSVIRGSPRPEKEIEN
jgi:hypothetical protein